MMEMDGIDFGTLHVAVNAADELNSILGGKNVTTSQLIERMRELSRADLTDSQDPRSRDLLTVANALNALYQVSTMLKCAILVRPGTVPTS